MADGTDTRWQLAGTVLISCNCDYGCPCNFNALPTTGKCEGHWTWHVDKGEYGDVELDGLNFSLCVDWPGAIHEGNGHALLLVDERADDTQREALDTLVSGGAGGPWGVLAWTWPTVDGPHGVSYNVRVDGVNSYVKAGEMLELESEPIQNPVTGAEVHPGAVLPEGIIFKQGDFGSSKTFRVANGIRYEHPGKYTAVAPFEYTGP
jgi:hypothetical protein